jgi:hypothetical protein
MNQGRVKMKGKPFTIQLLLSACILAFVVSPVFGFGITTPMDGMNRSYIFYNLSFWDSSSSTTTYYASDTNIQLGANSSASLNSGSLNYGGGAYSFEGTASPYSLHGQAVATNNSPTTWFLNTGTSFRDQLYFSTANGLPAELVFNFDLKINLANDSDPNNGYNYAMVLMVVYDGTYTGTNPDYNSIYNNRVYQAFDGPLSISTLGSNYPDGGLVLSGTYLPFNFAIATNGNNGSVNWLNSLTLTDVSVLQDGVPLGPGQYTLLSKSSIFPSTPVPVPSTLLLLGSALVGLIKYRRKLRK